MLIYNAKIDKSVTANHYAVCTTSKKTKNRNFATARYSHNPKIISLHLYIALAPLSRTFRK